MALVVAGRTERSKISTETTRANTPHVEQVRLVSSLLCGSRTNHGYFKFGSFRKRKCTAYDSFRGNGQYSASKN